MSGRDALPVSVRRTRAAGLTRVRVGVLGSGSISAYHIRGLQDAGAAVVGLFSRDGERVQAEARRHGVPMATTRYQDILDRRDIDAVVIATPDFTHAPMAVDAARAGKAILLQKPMARNRAECLEIIAAAEHAGVLLCVSFMHRYFPEIETIRRLLAEEALGSLAMVSQRNATPGADWAAWFYRKDQAAGGVVMQLGSHGIDLLRYLFGEIRAVQATTARTVHERTIAEGRVVVPELEDVALALYTFDSGLRGVHEMCYAERAGTDRFRLEIYGTRGTAWLRTERGPLAVHRDSGWVAPEIVPEDVGLRQHRHWLAMVRGEAPPDRSAHDGLAAVVIAEAIYRAAETHAEEIIR